MSLSSNGSGRAQRVTRPGILRLVALIALGLVFTCLVLIVVGVSAALSDPVERRASVDLPNLARDTPPLRIALVSDIHMGNFGMTTDRLNRIVGQINAARPDLILLAGDFVVGDNADEGAKTAPNLATPLSRLQAPLGVFAVLGNHDHWTAPLAIRIALTNAGITVLENQALRRGAFAIVGVGDRFSNHDDLPRAIAEADRVGGAPIIFTHSPDITPDLPGRFPLVLAGHTHCGQIVLPGIGPLIMYARGRRLYDPRYRCGQIRDGARLTIVTSGLGGSLPIRVNATPDWWLITVRSKAGR